MLPLRCFITLVLKDRLWMEYRMGSSLVDTAVGLVRFSGLGD